MMASLLNVHIGKAGSAPHYRLLLQLAPELCGLSLQKDCPVFHRIELFSPLFRHSLLTSQRRTALCQRCLLQIAIACTII